MFQDVTDSDIVKQVAGDARLDLGEIEETSEVHKHVSQANVTDWEFLTDRARQIGLDLMVVDGKLTLAMRAPSTGSTVRGRPGSAPPSVRLEPRDIPRPGQRRRPGAGRRGPRLG